MSRSLNNADKEFLTTVFNECIQQIRTKALYESLSSEKIKLVDNITHIREIAKKLDLKYITPKLK